MLFTAGAAEPVETSALDIGALLSITHDGPGGVPRLSVDSASLDATFRREDVSVPWGDLDGVPVAFAPTLHAASHAVGGGDALSLDAAQVASGHLAYDRMPFQTGTWAAGGVSELVTLDANFNTTGAITAGNGLYVGGTRVVRSVGGNTFFWQTSSANQNSFLYVLPNGVPASGASEFSVYSTDILTDAVNTERVRLIKTKNGAGLLQTTASGTGTVRALQLRSGTVGPGTMSIDASGVSLGTTTPSFGGGVGMLFMLNATTAPPASPVGGFLIYGQSGAAKCKGTSGTVTTFGPAEPHCPACGRDFMTEYENPSYGYLAVCLWCLAEELGPRSYILRHEAPQR